MLDLFATKFECYGDGYLFAKDECVFTVEAVEDCVCAVALKEAVSAADWPEVSAAIHAALVCASKPLAVGEGEDGGISPPSENKDNPVSPIIFTQGTSIFLEEVADRRVFLEAIKPRVLTVHYLHRSERYVCIHEPWSLNTFATSYEGLLKEVREQIIFLWKTYVRENDENLSEPAIAVKRRLMEDWEESEVES